MPYTVESLCDRCNEGDKFVIGLWPEHLGVLACQTCRAIVNVPLKTGQCPGCGYAPSVDQFYDYSSSIPYLGGQTLDELEPGPICPKCLRGRIFFEITMHVNVGRLGSKEGEAELWIGKDYLEKAIFVFALTSVCAELDLNPDEILKYYNLDIPRSLMVNRRMSLPIMLDIRNHLFAVSWLGKVPFRLSKKFEEARTRF